MSSARGPVWTAALGGMAVHDTLRVWWHETQQRERGGADERPIPWDSVLAYELRHATRASLLNTERMWWRERAADYEFVLFYEKVDGTLDIKGLLPIASSDALERVFVLSKSRRPDATFGMLAQRTHARHTYTFQTPRRTPPGNDHIYPLTSDWDALSMMHRHEWMTEPGALELHPGRADSDEAVWLARCMAAVEALVGVLLADSDAITFPLPDALGDPVPDYARYAAPACEAVLRHYLPSSGRRLATPGQRLGEWKARLYLQLWIASVGEAGTRVLLLRAQRLLMFALVNVGWYREAHVALLVRKGVLPVVMWRTLDSLDIGSAGSPWWRTAHCEDVEWEHECDTRVASVAEVGRPMSDGTEPPPSPVKRQRGGGGGDSSSSGSAMPGPAVAATNDVAPTLFATSARADVVDARYAAAQQHCVHATPVVTDAHFARQTRYSVAKSAFLVQARTHALLFADHAFHVLPVGEAGELYMRDMSPVRGQVQLDDVPAVPLLMLHAPSAEARRVVELHCIELAAHIADELRQHAGDAVSLPGVVEAPQLVPAQLSNTAGAPAAGRWVVVFEHLAVARPAVMDAIVAAWAAKNSSSSAVAAADDGSQKPRVCVAWRGHELSLTAHTGAGIVWPLDPLMVRIHPPPSAELAGETLRALALTQYVGNPAARPASAAAQALLASPPRRSGSFRGSFAAAAAASSSRAGVDSASPTAALRIVDDDRDIDTWCYSARAIRRAAIQRLIAFHLDHACRSNALPSCAYLVDSAPLARYDPSLLSRDLAYHTVLLYPHMARWIAALHTAHTESLGSADKLPRTFQAMQTYARTAMRPVLLTLQRRISELTTELMPRPGTGGLVRKSAFDMLRALENTLTDNFALPYLVHVFGGRQPDTRSGGTVLSFGDQHSRNFNVRGPRRGCWYDFRRRVGGRGILGFVANELYDDPKRIHDAHRHAAEWLATVDPSALPPIGDAPIAAGAPASDTPLLTTEQVAALVARSVHIADSEYFQRYFTETRGLRALPGELLRQWRDTSAVVALPSTKYFVEHGTLRACASLFVRLCDQDGALTKVQQTYLDAPAPPSRTVRSGTPPPPAKLRITHRDMTLPSKKTRNVVATTDAFVCVFRSPRAAAPVLLAEGLETALSVALAFPLAHVFVSCGIGAWRHFDRRRVLPDATTVVLCRDNDTGRGATATAAAAKAAVTALGERGYTVHQIRPLDTYGDFNDVHKATPGAGGTAAIVDMVVAQLPLLAEHTAAARDAEMASDDDGDADDDDAALMAIDIDALATASRKRTHDCADDEIDDDELLNMV